MLSSRVDWGHAAWRRSVAGRVERDVRGRPPSDLNHDIGNFPTPELQRVNFDDVPSWRQIHDSEPALTVRRG